LCFAISHIGLNMRCEPKISTGVAGLDSVLDGGFPKGSLIVLAGNPGTGKTVFSARFLYCGAVECGERGIYVSFCEGREAFMGNMRGFGLDFERLEERGLFRFLDMLTVREQAVLSVLGMIVDEVERFGAKRLVLDSFSAMAQAFKEPIDARIILHMILGEIIRGMGCTTILVEEVPYGSNRIGLGVEEFVADGVIMLRTRELEGYRLRDMEVMKMRGVRLKEPHIAFTLEGGFKAFQPFQYRIPEKLERFKPSPDPADKYSTGSESLDQALNGGVSKGSIMLLELDEKVGKQCRRLMLYPIAANFIIHGRGVLIIPSSGMDIADICDQIKIYGITQDDWEKYVRIVVPEHFMPLKPSQNIITLKGEDWAEDLTRLVDVDKRLTAETGQPNLSIINADTLLGHYGEKGFEAIINLESTFTRTSNGLTMAIVNAGFRELTIRLSAASDVYLRMTRKRGTPLLYGVQPRTGLYAVECDVSKGYPLAKLTPIV